MSNINENKDNGFVPEQLNLAGFDLDKSSMIEASAGTGKTFLTKYLKSIYLWNILLIVMMLWI